MNVCGRLLQVCAGGDGSEKQRHHGKRCGMLLPAGVNECVTACEQLESVLAGIDAQIVDLEKQILEKERWEIREEKREDTLAEEGRLG